MCKPIIETIDRFRMAPSGGGQTYAISVYLPEGEHAAESLPIVFVTDADYKFGMAAEMLGMQCASGVAIPAILVGIGYGGGFAETAFRRWRDLTLPTTEQALADIPLVAAMIGGQTGGAASFLDFLLNALTAVVRTRYPAASADRCLIGTSLGGLFATYALLTRPEAFGAVIIGSPALYWDRFSVLDYFPTFAEKLQTVPRKPRVFVGVGGAEEDLPATMPPGSPVSLEQYRDTLVRCRMISAARELADNLARNGSSEVEFVIFEGEGHQQVGPSVLNRGLRFVLSATRD